jgi:hypothetical protein
VKNSNIYFFNFIRKRNSNFERSVLVQIFPRFLQPEKEDFNINIAYFLLFGNVNYKDSPYYEVLRAYDQKVFHQAYCRSEIHKLSINCNKYLFKAEFS